LVAAYTTAKNHGAEFKLLNLSKKVHDLLQLTKLYTVFEVYDDETVAIAAFKYFKRGPHGIFRDAATPAVSTGCSCKCPS